MIPNYPRALNAALDEIDARLARRKRELRAELRQDRRTCAQLFAKNQKQFWGFLNLFRPQPLLSTEDAVDFYTEAVRHQLELIRAGDWKADEGKLAMCRNRQVMARYFRLYGKRLWTRRAA